MNATAVETLERRLDATRRALLGEQERLKGAVEQAAHAAGYVRQVEDGIRKSEQIIADLVEALDELRGWAPAPVDVPPGQCGASAPEPLRLICELRAGHTGMHEAKDYAAMTADKIATPTIITWTTLAAPCPSCGAGIGEPCRSPNGEPVEPHATRGAPS